MTQHTIQLICIIVAFTYVALVILFAIIDPIDDTWGHSDDA